MFKFLVVIVSIFLACCYQCFTAEEIRDPYPLHYPLIKKGIKLPKLATWIHNDYPESDEVIPYLKEVLLKEDNAENALTAKLLLAIHYFSIINDVSKMPDAIQMVKSLSINALHTWQGQYAFLLLLGNISWMDNLNSYRIVHLQYCCNFEVLVQTQDKVAKLLREQAAPLKTRDGIKNTIMKIILDALLQNCSDIARARSILGVSPISRSKIQEFEKRIKMFDKIWSEAKPLATSRFMKYFMEKRLDKAPFQLLNRFPKKYLHIIKKLLTDKNTTNSKRANAIGIILFLGGKGEAKEMATMIKILSQDKDRKVRLFLAVALGFDKDCDKPLNLEVLKRLAKDKDKEISLAAIWSLSGNFNDPRIIPTLRELNEYWKDSKKIRNRINEYIGLLAIAHNKISVPIMPKTDLYKKEKGSK